MAYKGSDKSIEKFHTALIQQEVILVTELLGAARDEDVLIPEEVLKARDLRLKRGKPLNLLQRLIFSLIIALGFFCLMIEDVLRVIITWKAF